MTTRIFAPEAMLPHGWAKNVLIEIDADGRIASVRAEQIPGGAEHAGGPVIPGMPNAHSHAFQRGLAGRTEHMGSPEDSFWTWREQMYGFVRRLSPEHARAIAAQVYVELLKNGYTAVAEFHYVHRTPDGRPYARPTEMAEAHLEAAREAGMGITLLPALYAWSNFGEQPLEPSQKRFASTPEDVLRMIDVLRPACRTGERLGAAPHSLRAVSPPLLKDLLAGLHALDAEAPVHMQIAEQVKEVNDCIAWSDARPVQWLLENMPVDGRWTLVHCTHVSLTEADRLAGSNAVIALCPSTEGNLGDGVFPFMRYLESCSRRDAPARYAIGSDSQVCRDPREELRWLEYVQRLTQRRRNVAATPARVSVGANLWRDAAHGGARSLAQPRGAIAPGCLADLLVLDPANIDLEGRSGDGLLDALVFASSGAAVKHVMATGHWVVRDGRHPREAEIETRYRAVQRELYG